MTDQVADTMSFGDVRRAIINDIALVREKKIAADSGAVIVGLWKELNSNIQVEINAAKLSLATEGHAHEFGRVVRMGQRKISGDGDES